MYVVCCVYWLNVTIFHSFRFSFWFAFTIGSLWCICHANLQQPNKINGNEMKKMCSNPTVESSECLESGAFVVWAIFQFNRIVRSKCGHLCVSHTRKKSNIFQMMKTVFFSKFRNLFQRGRAKRNDSTKRKIVMNSNSRINLKLLNCNVVLLMVFGFDFSFFFFLFHFDRNLIERWLARFASCHFIIFSFVSFFFYFSGHLVNVGQF